MKNEYNPQTILHPSTTLKEKLLEMHIAECEFLTKVKDSKEMKKFLDGVGSVTEEIAKELQALVKIPSHFWLNKQKYFDMGCKIIDQNHYFKACFFGNIENTDPDLLKFVLEALDKENIKYVFGAYQDKKPEYYVLNEDEVHSARKIHVDKWSEWNEKKK